MVDGSKTPKDLVVEGLADRPNIVFDIDHTLVHSVEISLVKKEAPMTKGRIERINVGKIVNLNIIYRRA